MTGTIRPARSRPRYLSSLLWLWLLMGCATTPGEPHALGKPPRQFRDSRVLLAANEGPSSPGESFGQQGVQGYTVPGRDSASQMPWEFFLGNAAHRLIAYMYKVNYPSQIVYFNNQTLLTILADIGDLSRLLPGERNLRPDITDISIRHVFEIKPWNATALQEGQQEVQVYLAALNRALSIGRIFTGGTNFQGQVLIRFAQGQYIWRLEWQTTAPGVIQYRWTRSQQRFESERAAYDAGQWVNLTSEEMRQYGGWVGQAVDEMVTRREQLATVSGVVGLFIDIVGETARGAFTGAIFGRMRSGSQPPAQGGGQVIPFPARPPATGTPAQIPAAAMGQ